MSSIEDRVANLEKVVFGKSNHEPRIKDWRRSVGRFGDDPLMREITNEALRAREEERRQAEIDCADNPE